MSWWNGLGHNEPRSLGGYMYLEGDGRRGDLPAGPNSETELLKL